MEVLSEEYVLRVLTKIERDTWKSDQQTSYIIINDDSYV